MSEVETIIDSIRVTTVSPERTIILQQKGAESYLPFWVSSSQADIIRSELVEPIKGTAPEAFLNNINAADSKIQSVTIHHLENNVFYATLARSHHDGLDEARCPIVIALALAVRANAPILVDEAVFDKAGVCFPSTPWKPCRKQPWWRRLLRRQS